MLNYIYHPAGPVVIRTTNPTITLTYSDCGWLTTQSFPDVLHDHPEWQSTPAPPSSTPTNAPKESIATRIGSAILSSLSATMAIVPSYAPSGVGSTAPIIVGSYGRDEAEQRERHESVGNSAPIHWMTAVERSWYQNRDLPVPIIGWLKCDEGGETFKYRLVSGELDIETPPPEYDADSQT
ncbi:hypothetical protein G6011_04462 [Alternaria panax]|uniref:Uncharacterized protein n=1 Tax=Alternaria panax TaxID=48097 RepID=A0AAD4IGJ8_9PLEO|nr:hypothetical protein G6011_04462 [Alternaria panax]